MKSLIILKVLPGYPFMANGMLSYETWLVEELKENNKVIVLVPSDKKIVKTKKNELGVDIYNIYIPIPFSSKTPIKSFINWIVSFPKAISQINNIISVNDIDLIHTTFHSYNYIFRIYKIFKKIQYVVTLHGSEVVFYNKIPREHRTLIDFVINGADHIITVSEALKVEATRRFPKLNNISTVYNGILEKNNSDLIKIKQMHLPNRFCLIVGRLHEVKGIDVAIDAWDNVTKVHPDIHLVIVGNGDKEGQYREMIHSINSSKNIHILGLLDNKTVRSIMEKAEILLVPSRSEGFGLVCLEAALAGLPIIASRVGGIPEIVNDNINGFLVPPEDPGSLAEKTIFLLENKKLQKVFSETLKLKVEKEFSAKKCASDYCNIYMSILSQKKY